MIPYLQGRKSHASASLRLPPGSAVAKSPHSDARLSAAGHDPGGNSDFARHTEAQVELVKEGDKVVRLVVTCVCGERVEIECLYPAGG